MLLNFHIPKYFAKNVNKEIEGLYAHSAISNMALSIAMLFEPIFLYAVLGFSVPKVLLFMAITYAVYTVLIPWGGQVASRYGYKHAMAMSVPFQIFYWIILLVAKDNTSLAFAAAMAFGMQKALYWPGYHSLMARYADEKQVGREFGVVYALTSMSHIVGPFVGGFLSVYFGFAGTFIIASLIQCFSLFPLFREREMFTPKDYKFSQTLELYKQFPKKAFGYFGFGEELLVLTVWPIFIYTVVKDYEKIGLLATVASFVAALLALIIGKITDQYAKHMLIRLGAFFSSLVWLARFIVNTIWNTLAVDTFSRTSKELAFIPISTVTYIQAEKTHVVPYVVFFEQSLAIGKLLACILGIVLFSLTGSFMVLFVLGAGFSLLYMLI